MSNPNIEMVERDFANKPFQEGTPIYSYATRKIELCDTLRSCGFIILESLLLHNILKSLPHSWDEAVKKIFEEHNPKVLKVSCLF